MSDETESNSLVLEIDLPEGERNRASVAFRIFLAIPHLLIVGGFGFVFSWNDARNTDGALFAAAAAMAFVAWFAIIFTGRHPKGLWDFGAYFVRWWVRVAAYVALLVDVYPPFGDDPYVAKCTITPPGPERDRLRVLLRPILIIPHAFVLFFVNAAWFVISVIAWFMILFTGTYPPQLLEFSTGVLRWNTRVIAYGLLLDDQYPPFSWTI